MKSTLHKIVVFILTACMLLSLTACATTPQADSSAPSDTTSSEQSSGSEQAATPTESATPAREDIIVGISTDFTTLDVFASEDSYSNNVMFNCYDNIVRLKDGNIVPGFATSWEVDDTGTEWTLHLTEGNKTETGNDVNAEDVKFTIEKAAESTGSVKRAKIITNVTVVDNNTVKLTLEKPYGSMLGLLAILPVVEKDGYLAAGENVAFNNGDSCTGPYKVVEWVKGQYLTMEANTAYHGEAPAIKTVTYQVIADKSAGVIALQTGAVDAYFAMNPADAPVIAEDPNLELAQGPGTGVYFLALNQKDELMQNEKLRKAIYLAINKDDIVLGAFDGAANVAESPCPTSFVAAPQDFKATPYNLEMAKQLLIEAGFPNGVDLELNIIADEMYTKTAQIIQDQLRQIGITLNIVTAERGAWFADVYANMSYQMTILRYTPPIFDADTALFDSFCSEGAFFFNQSNTPDLDALLIQGRYETDLQKRIDIYTSILKYIDEHAIEVPLVNEVTFLPHKTGLNGVSYSSNEIYRIFNWSWSN